MCAYRLTSPGIGKEAGCTLGENRNMYLGLFHAPTVVASALKTAVFAASLFSLLGYEVLPKFDGHRTDIIQTVCLKDEPSLTAFCQGIQKGSPVDSFVVPEAWDMPGYESQVIDPLQFPLAHHWGQNHHLSTRPAQRGKVHMLHITLVKFSSQWQNCNSWLFHPIIPFGLFLGTLALPAILLWI